MPTTRITPPFRAEHVGSLKRPVHLLEKRADFDAGRCTKEELHTCEDDCIRRIVDMQKMIGLKSITDGEYRRFMFYDGMFDQLEGMEKIWNAPEPLWTPYTFIRSVPSSQFCVAKIRRTKSLYGEAFDSLKEIAGAESIGNIKVTMCAPEWYHFRHGSHSYKPGVYRNDAEFFADVAQVYREEIQDLYSRGCLNIQIDDPVLASFADDRVVQLMRDANVDPDALLDSYIQLHNNCLRDRPHDMTVGIHICRGNFKGRFFNTGGYDRIAVKVFGDLNVDCYYLEYDTDRAGNFEPLRYLPKNKFIVLGLISTKEPKLEDTQVLQERVLQAASVIAKGIYPRSQDEALDQLCISPQCGFSSHCEGTDKVTAEDMVKKLELVVSTARMIWS